MGDSSSAAQEGWGFPTLNGRPHYFRGGHSLCGKYKGVPSEHQLGYPNYPCVRCKKQVEDEEAAKSEARLSPTQREALEVVRTHGSLVRYRGGFWSWPDAPGRTSADGVFIPKKSFGASTVDALWRRGLVVSINGRGSNGSQVNLPGAHDKKGAG